MFCASCGKSLAFNSNFCSHCGKPVHGQVPAPAPQPPALQACFQCAGTGKVHKSSMPHREGCIFCETCPGCSGKGVIPGVANLCPHCKGEGKVHDSPLAHNNSGCIFCVDCNTCHKKGWI